MRKVYSFLAERTTGKRWLSLLVVSQGILILMSTLIFPYISARAGGIVAFDMRPFGYTAADARAFLGAIDSAGLSVYRFIQLPLDVPYPTLICLLFVSTFILLYRATLGLDRKAVAGLRPAPWLIALCSVPVIGMLGDYAENVCIYAMLNKGPAASAALIQCANFFTLTKSISTTIDWSAATVFAIVALIAVTRRRLSKR